MNTQNLINGMQGCAQGYFFSQQALGIDFTAAGNSYSTILPRMVLISELAIMGLYINAAIPHPSQALFDKTLRYMPFISVAMAAAVALVREGDYPGPSLPPLARKTCCFLAENWDEMSIAAMGAGAVGFAILGNPVYGASILAALTYNVLDRRGYVDERISKFIVKFMPAVSSATIIATNGLSITGCIAAMQLAKILLPTSQDIALQYRVDHLFRLVFGVSNVPSLEELEKPLPPKLFWSSMFIEKILHKEADAFELNPAHLSKPLQAYVDLPQDRKFSRKIPALFDHTIWDNDLVLTVLKQNNRFLNFMTQKLPDVDRRDMKETPIAIVSADGNQQENIDRHKQMREYIAQVAQQTKPNMTAEEFIDDWIRTKITKITARVEEDLAPDAPQSVIETKKLCAQLFWCIPRLSQEDQTKILLTLALGAENTSWEEIEEVSAVIIERLLEDEEARSAIVQDPLDKATVITINKYKQIRKKLLQEIGIGTLPIIQAGIYPMSQQKRRSLNLLFLTYGLNVGFKMRKDIYADYKQEIFDCAKLEELWSEEKIASWLMLLLPNAEENGPLIARLLKAGDKIAFRNLILYRLGVLHLKA